MATKKLYLQVFLQGIWLKMQVTATLLNASKNMPLKIVSAFVLELLRNCLCKAIIFRDQHVHM